jgi:flagellar motor switch protein FliN
VPFAPTTEGIDMADDSKPLNNDDIEALLSQVSGDSDTGSSSAGSSSAGSSSRTAIDDNKPLNNDDIERLLDQTAASLDEAAGAGVNPSRQAKPFSLGNLQPDHRSDQAHPIDLIGEVEMDLRIELGRTEMRLEEILQLRSGSVVALDKLAGDPVDVFANGKLIARGEVLVMNDNFCIRVTELVGA